MADRSADASSRKVTAVLARSFDRADANVNRLNKMLASSANADTALLTTGYTFYLVHAVLARLENVQLHVAAQNLALRLAALAPRALLPGEAVIATISASPTSRLVRAKQSAKALATLISTQRMFMRLLNLPKFWAWGMATYRHPPTDPLLRSLTWVQIVACVLFQYLENSAFLAANGVIAMAPETIGQRFRWSARFWATHVMLQFVVLGRRRQLDRQEEEQEQATTATAVEKRSDEVVQAQRVKEAKWWRDLYVNAAWAPLTVHWSTTGYMPDEGVGLLCLTAGWLGLRQAWLAAA